MKKLLVALAVSVEVATGFSDGLPSGYKMIEYIEGSGSQCLSSFYTTTADTKLLMDFTYLTPTSQQKGIVGNSWGYYSWFFSSIYGTFHGGGGGLMAATPNVEYLLRMGQGYTAITNKTTLSGKAQQNSAAVRTINILNCGSGYWAAARIHALQLFEGTDLVRDCWPCVNPSGVAGLYDVVNGVFYQSSSATAFIAGPEGRVNALLVTSTHPDYGEPTCTQQTGYGAFLMTDGETATVTMPETTITAPLADMELLGWQLVVTAADGSVTTNESAAATFDTCTYVHEEGNKATLLWRWKQVHKIVATASDGLVVTQDVNTFDDGETVTVHLNVRETTDQFVGWYGDAVPVKDLYSTNLTLTVSQGVAVRACAIDKKLYVTPEAGGTGASWADPAPLADALAEACATPYSKVYLKAGLYPVGTALKLTNTAALVMLEGGYSGADLEKGGETVLARTDESVQTRILECSAATFVASHLVISNGYVRGTVAPGWGASEPSGTCFGQGVLLEGCASAVFDRCAFLNNGANAQNLNNVWFSGGAIASKSGLLTVRDCSFRENILRSSGLLAGSGGAIAVHGGEVYVSGSSFVTNGVQCTSDARTVEGGAIRLRDVTAAVISDCTFDGNYARRGSSGSGGTAGYVTTDLAPGLGGAISAVGSSGIVIRDSFFDGNWVNVYDTSVPLMPQGGTMHFWNSQATVLRTVVRRGGLSPHPALTTCCGGVDLIGGTLALTNVLVADTWGGWAAGNWSGTLTAKNCTFAGARGNGWNKRPAVAYQVYGDAAATTFASFRNCIFWDNAAGDFGAASEELTTVTSCIGESPHLGAGNRTDDPLFADTIYYHVLSRAGRYGDGYFVGGRWITGDTADSPSIDMDRIRMTIVTEPQPNGRHVNAGYDGDTSVAAKSTVADPPTVDESVLGVVAYPDVQQDDMSLTFFGDLSGTGDPSIASAHVKVAWGYADGGTGVLPGDWYQVLDCGQHAPWDGASASVIIEDLGLIHYRFYADDGNGHTVWSSPCRTYLFAEKPTLVFDPDTDPVTRIYNARARVNLKLVANGGAETTVSVTYRPTDGSADPVTVHVNEGSAVPVGSFSVELTGLATLTEYALTATAVNSAGSVTTEETTFTTASCGFTGLLPHAYTPLTYVKTTGSQALGSFYTTTLKTTVKMDFRALTRPGNQFLILGNSWSFNDYAFLDVGGSFYTKSGSSIAADTLGVGYHVEVGPTSVVVSNYQTHAISQASVKNSAVKTISAFGISGFMSNMEVYGLEVFEGDDPSRDFWPCLDPNGVPGLFDSVEQRFYKSATPYVAGEPDPYAADVLDIVGDPLEVSTPTGDFVNGYGRLHVVGGQTVTVKMPVTSVDTPTQVGQLLGWKLEVTEGGTTTTTYSGTDDIDTCTYSHGAGASARLTWRWQVLNRITVTADAGLEVTQDKTTFLPGETVTVNVSVRETSGRFFGWEGAAVPAKDMFATNLTLTVSDGIALRARIAAQELCVAQEPAGLANGSSWGDAMSLSNALVEAIATPFTQLYLRDGLYPVTAPYLITNTAGPVRLAGGFAGTGMQKGGETLLARVTPSLQTRILDCSAATFCAEDLVISNGWSKGSNPSAVYRYGQGVRLADGCVACFEGCAFRNNSDTTLDDQTYCGGAIGAKGGTLVVRDCLFWKNRLYGNGGNVKGGGGAIGADQTALYVSDTQFVSNYLQSVHKRYIHGGAMRIMSAPDVEIANCTFDGNYVRHSTGSGNYTSSPQLQNEGAGGALTIESCPRVTIRDSYFDANWNGSVDTTYTLHPFGGTIRMNDSSVAILRSVFRRGGLSDQTITSNLGKYTCGGIDLVGGTLAMTNVLVADTWTAWAIGNKGGTVLAKNCTVTGVRGYGWANRPAVAYMAYSDTTVISDSRASFDDCVFWNNAGGDYNVPFGKEPVFAACIAQAQQPGAGNITCDPLFEDGFFHVKSAAGNYAGGYFGGGAWVTTNTVTSRAIDLDPARAVLATEPQPNGLHVNAGYDGNTAVASKSVVAEPPVVGDALGMVAYPDVSGEAGDFTFYGDVTGTGDAAVPVTFVWDLEDRGTASVAAWAHAIDCGSHAPWTGVTATTNFDFEGSVAYRFVADGGAAGLKWSNPARQFTIAVLPTLAYDPDSLPVTHVYRTTARVNLKLVSNGGADTTVTVTYQPADESSDPVTVQALSGAVVPVGVFDVDLPGLAVDTEYKVYATAANMMGEVSTAEQTFTTRKAGDALTLCVAEKPSGYGDGRSWAHPTDFTTALAAATGAADEIRVQEGRYTVNELATGTRLSNRTLTIRGGYGTDGTPHAGETVFTASDVAQVNSRIFRFSGCTVLLDSITFTNGRNGDSGDSYGQAIGCYDATSLTVTNCTFTENGNFNLASDNQFNGGAIGTKGGTLTVLGCQFVHNSIHGGGNNVRPLGGAIGATHSATLVVRNSGFHRNYGQMLHGRGYGGGAIGVSGCAQLSVESCLFTTNYVHPGNDWYTTQMGYGPYGGTLYVYNTPTTLRNLTVEGSWAYYGENAAKGWDFGGTFYFEGSVVGGENIDIRHAGYGTLTPNAGSGSITVRSGTVALTNLLHAASGYGALISHLGGTLEIVNGTFADARGLGSFAVGAVYSQYTAATSGSAAFRNCICWNNAAGFRSHTNNTMTVTIDHCDIEGLDPDPSIGLISADPKFKLPKGEAASSPLEWDYSLRSSSPCINAGSNAPWNDRFRTATDLSGGPRIRALRVDMGCYECEKPGLAIIVK